MGRTAGLVALCFGSAVLTRQAAAPPVGYWLPVIALGIGGWLTYVALAAHFDGKLTVVLRLWGLEWTRDEACCHFFITGATGTGKTARAVVPIVHGLRSTLPDTGILAVDSKGALWKPLSAMATALGQKDTLRLIRVRPTHIPLDQWVPPLRLNLLGDASVPWSTYAKIIVDTATASGQRGGQAFFKETARDAIAHAMHALEAAELPVTLANVHDAICVSSETALLLARLAEHPGPAAEKERQYFSDFHAQPPEQKSGTVYTVANYLRPLWVTRIPFEGRECAFDGVNAAKAVVAAQRLLVLGERRRRNVAAGRAISDVRRCRFLEWAGGIPRG